ncbi:NAD(P)-dependent oxidoreductase [Streptomyces sp. NPDC057496]|uniref:NAD(P)-dependent oxidoreductase n=1 Tax=Streptomyces sp. NPDC057496 TaxID=3346149 RepID=UPI0036C8BED2
MAESCLAGILALHRGIDELSGLRSRGTWAKSVVRPRLRLLSGARVLVLGRGSIARRLAELLGPFGCPISHFARGSGDIRTLAELDVQLPDFDVVVGLLPGTPGTSGLLDTRRLARMRPGAVLVNAGRGSLVDEEALMSELSSGRLGGAVLDVTGQEPLPAGHPLWTCPNVILTQHTAGGSTDETARVIDLFAENLRRFETDAPLRNPVQWARGFRGRDDMAEHTSSRMGALDTGARIAEVRPVLLSAPYADPENLEVRVALPTGRRTTGLVEVTLDDGTTGLGERYYDMVQPDATVVGGPRQTLAVFAGAAEHGVAPVVHCWGSAVCQAADYHAAFAGGGRLAEWPLPAYALRSELLVEPFRIESGRLLAAGTGARRPAHSGDRTAVRLPQRCRPPLPHQDAVGRARPMEGGLSGAREESTAERRIRLPARWENAFRAAIVAPCRARSIDVPPVPARRRP